MSRHGAQGSAYVWIGATVGAALVSVFALVVHDWVAAGQHALVWVSGGVAGAAIGGLATWWGTRTARLRTYVDLFEQAAHPIAQMSLQGRFLRVNEHFVETLGYDAAAVIGMHFLDVTHPDDADRSREIYEGILAGRETEEIEKRYIRRDGTVMNALVHARAQRDRRGRPISVVAHIVDLTQRDQARRALHESEEKYRALFEASTDAVFVMRDTVADCNAQACRMLGVSKEELIGKGPAEYSPPYQPNGQRSAELAQQYISAALAGTPQRFQWQHRRTDGTPIDTEVGLVAVPLAGERWLLCTVHDTREQKRTTDTLRWQRDLATAFGTAASLDDAFAETLEITTGLGGIDCGGVYLCDPTTGAVRLAAHHNISGEFATEAGYYEAGSSQTAIIMAGVPRYLSLAELEDQYANLLQYGLRSVAVVPLRHEGKPLGSLNLGSYAYDEIPLDVRDSLETLAAQLGELIWYGRVEEALRASEQKLRAMIDVAPIGIQVHDAEGVLIDANPAARALLEKADAAGQMLFDSGWLTPEAAQRLREGELARCEYTREAPREFGTHAPGQVLTELHITVAPLVTDGGPPRGYLTLIQDFTERRQLERELRQSQKLEAIGQLAGGVAHDFNNILTAILGNVGLIQDQFDGDPERSPADPIIQGLQQIERSAQRAAKLTRQLLAFSRRQLVQPEVLDLNRVLTDMQSMLRRLISESIALEMHLGLGPLRIRIDAGQIEQIILNLVVNARDAMPGGGRLALVTSHVRLDAGHLTRHRDAQPGPHVVLEVADTGCGMSRETLERIFEPFFTTKPVDRGTGLGLATVYGIVRQAGGHIAVDSELERGTTFRIYLPAVEAGHTERDDDDEAQPRPPRGTETILVVEDDRTVRELAVRVLREAGYRVLVAANGPEALDCVSRHGKPVDLLLTDVIMPEMDGRRVSTILSAEDLARSTLYMSGYPADIVAKHGVLDEGIELLQKPFSGRILLARVRDLLDRERGGDATSGAARGTAASATRYSP